MAAEEEGEVMALRAEQEQIVVAEKTELSLE
jgi:hypothetical protein